jgi:hypothetical protein
MATAPSFDELLAIGRAEAQTRRPDLTFSEGDITEAHLHASAAMADHVIGYVAREVTKTFIDGASGDDLTYLVGDHLGIQRRAASPAQVLVTFTRTSTVLSGTIPAGTQVGTEFTPDGAQVVFTTAAPVIVDVGVGSVPGVLCNCTVTGPEGNVKAGTVTKVISQLFDTFTVTNPLAAGGGNAAESDEDLRQRAKAFWSTVRRGTLAALEYGAKLVPTCRIAHVTEDQTTGLVTVQVSDQDGGSTVQMVSDVQAELENWRCAGVVLTVVGGAAAVLDLDITLRARAGFSVAAATDLLVAAVKARIGKLRVGETLYLDQVIGAIYAVAPDDVLDVGFTSISVDGVAQPIADVVPAAGKILRAGTVTIAAVA